MHKLNAQQREGCQTWTLRSSEAECTAYSSMLMTDLLTLVNMRAQYCEKTYEIPEAERAADSTRHAADKTACLWNMGVAVAHKSLACLGNKL